MSGITRTIDQVNRGIKAMQFVAGNAYIFAEGFEYQVWNSTISVWIYASYDANNDEIEGSTKTNLAKLIRACRRAIPGATTEKVYNDYQFITKVIGPDFTVMFQASRKKVCERIVTGTIQVEEIDYDRAPKKMVDKEVIEWRCDSILESA